MLRRRVLGEARNPTFTATFRLGTTGYQARVDTLLRYLGYGAVTGTCDEIESAVCNGKPLSFRTSWTDGNTSYNSEGMYYGEVLDSPSFVGSDGEKYGVVTYTLKNRQPESFEKMFSYAHGLVSLDMRGIDTSKVKTCLGIFEKLKDLKEVYFDGSWESLTNANHWESTSNQKRFYYNPKHDYTVWFNGLDSTWEKVPLI